MSDPDETRRDPLRFPPNCPMCGKPIASQGHGPRCLEWAADFGGNDDAALASSTPDALDVEALVRLSVHMCRGRLLTTPADELAAVRAVLAARDRA